MASISLTLDTRRAKADGTYPLCYYISFNARLRIRLKANISVRPENWNGTEIIPRKENATLNMILEEQTYKLKKAVMALEMSGKSRAYNNIQLKEIIEDEVYGSAIEPSITLNDFFLQMISSKRKNNTKCVYELTRRKIEMFAGLQLTFNDIDIQWLRRFESYLIDLGTSVNGINLHMRNIRAVYNNAIDDHKADANLYPFRRFKLKSEATPKRSLSIEKIVALKNYRCRNKGYREAVDTFMLIFYMRGINYFDLCNLSVIEPDSTCTYRRAKTGRLYTVKIEPEAREIISKYPGKKYLLDFNERCLDYKSHLANINKRLKKIARELKFPGNCNISTYWARHSCATIAANLDIPRDTIAAMLGHGQNTVTDIYIDFSQAKVDAAMRKVIDSIKAQDYIRFYTMAESKRYYSYHGKYKDRTLLFAKH